MRSPRTGQRQMKLKLVLKGWNAKRRLHVGTAMMAVHVRKCRNVHRTTVLPSVACGHFVSVVCVPCQYVLACFNFCGMIVCICFLVVLQLISQDSDRSTRVFL